MPTSKTKPEPDTTLSPDENTAVVTEESASAQYEHEYALPTGTAYVTPDGVMGVVGDYEIPERPFASANIEALYAMQHAIRKESAYR
jgi:hypothetical protein